MKFNITKENFPNILTMVRIWIAFLLVAFLIFFGTEIYSDFNRFQKYRISLSWIMFVFFTLAIATDFADGYLARKWKVVSDYGKLWDPLADKIITIVALVYLILANWFNPGLVVLIVIRDLIVDGLRIQMARKQMDVKASKLAKIKTFYISILIIVTLLLNGIFLSSNGIPTNVENLYSTAQKALSIVVLIGLIGAVIISYVSGYQYLEKSLKHKQ
ncbi:CDP-diacylglycerol--glycerol-3-phosphate 3-phosphatidyltransferase [Mycoplasmopsis citelli]|nr:CDP-diacylglycerol--glycerol-3-phosphate 3-phosphatidyltransferase [Mycoplasmopsis citelli]UUD36402.1 CDP-diacylglycerol--glycerol-3-phosphate 3-phosphatidyltransferase [Mycoplasmopsis citelli]